MTKILIVEDEKKVSAFIQQGLQEVGYSTHVCDTPAEAREHIKKQAYDLMVLDVMLPETNGVEFAKEIRKNGFSGFILMLTALSTTNDKIQGLDAGADDYLTKPFEFEELLARVRALMRRKTEDKAMLRNGDLSMDLISRHVIRDGIRIELTTKEFSLLEFLM